MLQLKVNLTSDIPEHQGTIQTPFGDKQMTVPDVQTVTTNILTFDETGFVAAISASVLATLQKAGVAAGTPALDTPQDLAQKYSAADLLSAATLALQKK